MMNKQAIEVILLSRRLKRAMKGVVNSWKGQPNPGFIKSWDAFTEAAARALIREDQTIPPITLIVMSEEAARISCVTANSCIRVYGSLENFRPDFEELAEVLVYRSKEVMI